jgi:chemotaxis protein MotB
MFGLDRKPRRASGEPVEYWMSYSDLMAGLVLVFVLLLVYFITLSKTQLEERQRELDAQSGKISSQTKQLSRLDEEVSQVLGVREALLARVKTRFEEAGGEITFDDATGAVRLGSKILFEEGSDDLSREGKRTLDRVIPLYYEALLGDERLRGNVDQIIFEGHTNSNFSKSSDADRAYLFNLRLSQRRAYAAMEYIIEQDVGSSYGAKTLLAAIGYSNSRLIYEGDGATEDKERSRRLEIRFRLKDEEALSSLRSAFGSIRGTAKGE